MRRLLILGLVLVGAAAALVLGSLRSSAEGSSTARFDVIFDNARGLIGGQLVKVAGARAGVIENVVVTPDFKARIEANIDSRFMPFHADATCTIRPEGLIAENYIDCNPGSLGSPPLRPRAGKPPTIGVTHTTEPVSLLDLFNIFNLPTRQRFTVIVNELGIGTAGRGDDFNQILRRANPTLALARQVIEILARQRSQLSTAVEATDRLAAEGAAHPRVIQRFLERAAALSSLTASHRAPLSLALRRLPGLLAAAQPSLAALDTVASDGTPLVAQLHAAVPALNRVAQDLGPFASAAQPALGALRQSLRRAIPAIRDATPLVRTVAAYTRRSLPGTRLFARLTSNLQRHGFAENFLSIFYYITSALARYDGTSHLLSLLLVGAQSGQCGNYATQPVAGCSAHFGQQPAYSPQAVRATGATRSAPAASTARLPRASGVPAPGKQHGALPGAGPARSGVAAGPASSLQRLVGYLLR